MIGDPAGDAAHARSGPEVWLLHGGGGRERQVGPGWSASSIRPVGFQAMAGSPSSKRQALAALAAVDPDVVFSAPNLDLLYTREELARVAQGVVGVTIPSSQGVVAKSQWVKYLFLEHLGYPRPRGLRTSRARAAKPKFLHQLMDVFVQSSDNLQVWNYLPGSDVKLLDPADKATQLPVSFKECRMVLFFHDLGGTVRVRYVATGAEVASWGTSTQTTKWQATITRYSAPVVANKVTVAEGDHPLLAPILAADPAAAMAEISRRDAASSTPLAHTEPQPGLVLPLVAIGDALVPLVGATIPITARGHRVDAQEFERRIAVALGYTTHATTHGNTFPDLLHQILEVKLQTSPTIDLGRHLPISTDTVAVTVGAETLPPAAARYAVGLVAQAGDSWRVTGIVLTPGANFQQFFSLCEGENFKTQLHVPRTIWIPE